MTPRARRLDQEPSSQTSLAESQGRAALQGATEFYRRVVEGMTCGVLTVDRDGLITTLNEHARAILDLDGKSVIGSPCQQVLSHCPRLAQVLIESFSMSSPPNRAEMEIRTRDRRGRTIGFSISMITTRPSSPPEGAALFFKDLTRVEEQEERERLRDRLAALGEMAAQMAHEIRNPLTSIEVSATLLRRRLAARGEPTELVEKIASEVGRIEMTIANCLEYARPLSPGLARTEAAVMLDEAITLARERTHASGVKIERFYEPDLPAFYCDSPLIREAIVNVLINAYEAMGGHGAITLTAESAPARRQLEPEGDGADLIPSPAEGSRNGFDRYLVLRIRDTGPGIPGEFKDRIFYPFFTTKTKGSGIGLATTRKVVEAHGGVVDVESEPGRGATFILKIPMLAAPPAGGRA